MNEHDEAPRPCMPPPLSGAMPPPDAPAMPSRAARTFGILSMIFGGLTALGGLFQTLGPLLSRGMSSFWKNVPTHGEKQADEMFRRMGEMQEILASAGWAQAAQGLILLLLSGALIGIGLGQYRFRRWAAQASVSWGLAALAALVVMVVLDITVVAPATREAMAKMAEGMPEGTPMAGEMFSFMGSLASTAGVVGRILSYAPYPVILLVAFRRPRVIESLTT